MANELLNYGLDECKYQLERAFEGLTGANWSASPIGGWSAAGIAEHLCEVYTAFAKHARGEEHDWGTYQSGETTEEGTKALMWRLRAEACALAQSGDEKMEKAAIDYIVLHDPYHVAQLVAIQLALDPNWNAYSIYRGS